MKAYWVTVIWGKAFVEVDSRGYITTNSGIIFKKFWGRKFTELKKWVKDLNGEIEQITGAADVVDK